MDLKELLGEELYNQVQTKIGDKKLIINDGSYLPKEKFDEVNGQKKALKEQIDELNTQIDTLKKASKGNEELTKQIEELQKNNSEWEGKYKTTLLDTAIKMSAIKANAKDPGDILAFIDKTKLELNEDGTIKGLDEQLETLTKSKSYLFGEITPDGGANPANNNNGQVNPWAKETYNLTLQGKLITENPTLAAQLMAAAKKK